MPNIHHQILTVVMKSKETDLYYVTSEMFISYGHFDV